MFADNVQSRYTYEQKKRIVNRLMIEGSWGRGWSPLKTYYAIKEGTLKVHPAMMDWEDDSISYHWEFDGISEQDLRRKEQRKSLWQIMRMFIKGEAQ